MASKNSFLNSFVILISFILISSYAPLKSSPTAAEQVKRLGRGVNIIGYDPIWKDFSQGRFKEKHFKLIKDGGFQTVRINLHAFSHMDAATLALEPQWLKTLDWAIDQALQQDLMVILDLHNFTDFALDPIGLKPKFIAFWQQIAPRYKDAPDNVLFEILNEPNQKLDAQLWDAYYREALAIIRATNPTRTVVIGPPDWNSINSLDKLQLPEEDRNIIVTVHYYLPMRFTHQGALWAGDLVNVSGVTWGTAEEKQALVDDFQKVQNWAVAHDRPILLGEFGAYDKGDPASRAAYTAHCARTAEAFGWAWTYWQFDSDFIVYDIDNDKWVEGIYRALIE